MKGPKPIDERGNRRDNRVIEFDGQSMPLMDWAKATGVSFNGLRWRLESGWSIERALTTPAGGSHG